MSYCSENLILLDVRLYFLIFCFCSIKELITLGPLVKAAMGVSAPFGWIAVYFVRTTYMNMQSQLC